MGAESILVKPEIRIYGSTMFGAESEMSLTESTVIIVPPRPGEGRALCARASLTCGQPAKMSKPAISFAPM